MESFPNDLINDTLARLSMRLKILFEEDYVKMRKKKEEKKSKSKMALLKKRILPEKNGWISNEV